MQNRVKSELFPQVQSLVRRLGQLCLLLYIFGGLIMGDCQAAEIEFKTSIAPLLCEHCLRCHQGSKAKAGLDFTTAMSALKGGEGGPVILPGNPAESLLIARIKNGSMPPEEDGRQLTPAEVQAFSTWIADGAKWPAGVVLKAK